VRCAEAINQITIKEDGTQNSAGKAVRRYMYEKYDDQARIVRYIQYFEWRKYELENDYRREYVLTEW
jgi:hypothetical protein